jgi:hypothetical protein
MQHPEDSFLVAMARIIRDQHDRETAERDRIAHREHSLLLGAPGGLGEEHEVGSLQCRLATDHPEGGIMSC